MPHGTSGSGRRRRLVRVVPAAYSTYAPTGHVCAACKQPISAGKKVLRLATDHSTNGQRTPDYRHRTCFYPKRPAKGAR